MAINNETARERLDDIRELEPTSNSELRDRWGMDTTKDVARYLREELGEYTYRDNNSKIRANAAEPDTADETPEEPDTSTNTDTSEPAEDEFSEVPIPDDDEPISDGPEEDAVGGESGENSDETAAQTDIVSGTLTAPSNGSQTTDSDTLTASAEPCPDCSASLDYARERLPFFAMDGGVLTVEPGDGICDRCNLVVTNDGDVICGIESEKAPPTPPCSKCDSKTIAPDHAKYLLTVYYKNTSSLDVLGRRRIKKIARHIEKTDANYVCPSCWTSYA